MARPNANTLAHLEWLGFVQPTGLVVSAPALDKAGVVLQRSDREGKQRLQAAVEERRFEEGEAPRPFLPDFEEFARSVLDWKFSRRGYGGGSGAPLPDELSLHLPDYGEIWRPDFAVREREPEEGASDWQLLVRTLKAGQDFDRVAADAGRLEASPHSRLERLLRAKNVPAGLPLQRPFPSTRLGSARRESSGWMDFRVADMLLPAGRPICTALRLLLNERRLLALPRNQRLAALLADSRKYQNEVSEKLAVQVLHALYELLRGFQAAHDASRGDLLNDQLREDPGGIYRGLLTVVLRLVFLLFAEERDLLSEDETFVRNYSLAGLHDRLRADAALHPDTMDQRFGAWAQLLALFRMIHNGAKGARLRLPPRHGVLFDPDRYEFLEGRPLGAVAQNHERVKAPLVSDGTIHRALAKLLVLDAERLSYRALDVEHIGAVYETMMGFRLERAEGRSAAIKAAKKHGAPATVNLEALLAEAPGSRVRWLRERTDRNLTGAAAKALRGVATLDELHAALDKIIDRDADPRPSPHGRPHPPAERRAPPLRVALHAAGTHRADRPRHPETDPRPAAGGRRQRAHRPACRCAGLTSDRPRTGARTVTLTARGRAARVPARIRRRRNPLPTLRQPTLARPQPEQILDLKVCDPAMGSGAFLVEACRQLANVLVDSWHAHDALPPIPPDEDETVHARRLVARNCLYGVDRNPVAVDLAKLSLWLVTLARDHPLTFSRPRSARRRLARGPDPGADPGVPLERRGATLPGRHRDDVDSGAGRQGATTSVRDTGRGR